MNRIITTVIICIAFSISCEYEQINDESDCGMTPVTLEIISISNTPCNDGKGSISLSANGGRGSYEFQLNGNGFQNVAEYDNLSSGIYTITVRDIDTGCEDSEPVTIENEDGFSVSNVTISNADCDTPNGTITIEVQDAIGPVNYSLNGSSPQNVGTFTSLDANTYSLTISDSNGCQVILDDLEVLADLSLTNDIQPIISENCAISGCHNGARSPNLSTENATVNNSNRIRARTSAGTMPPSSPLSQEEINVIICWVDNGSPNN